MIALETLGCRRMNKTVLERAKVKSGVWRTSRFQLRHRGEMYREFVICFHLEYYNMYLVLKRTISKASGALSRWFLKGKSKCTCLSLYLSQVGICTLVCCVLFVESSSDIQFSKQQTLNKYLCLPYYRWPTYTCRMTLLSRT